MEKLDILNRDDFIEQLLKLVENISSNKSSTCFALNGAWGCGKSFVLDMFEARLAAIQSEETSTDKYFIIRYNSWKFDYYQEPLVAIVSTMISAIEAKTKLFPDSKKWKELKGVLKAVAASVWSNANTALKEKIGVDIQKTCDTIRNGKKEGAAAFDSEHDYDAYLGFNNAMEELKKQLLDLSKSFTIVFIVDELDRCLPEYAIKVLERLHHLTEETPNIITIISVDKAQLTTSVKQIFGFENPEKYLEKFMSFEVKLDFGTVSERISEKYAGYIELFDKDVFLFEDSVEECLQAIFKEIDIRTQEQLVKRAMLAHKLLYSDKKDYSFMCMELLLAVMICLYDDDLNTPVDASSLGSIFLRARGRSQPAFANFFKEKLEEIHFRRQKDFSSEPERYILPEVANLYCAIFYLWYWIHKTNPEAVIQYTKGGVYEPISKNYESLKIFAETIKMMK